MPDGSKVAVKVQGSDRFAAIPAKRLHRVLEILAELLGDVRTLDQNTGKLKIHRLSAAQIARPETALVDSAPEHFFETAAEIESLKPRSPVTNREGGYANQRVAIERTPGTARLVQRRDPSNSIRCNPTGSAKPTNSSGC